MTLPPLGALRGRLLRRASRAGDGTLINEITTDEPGWSFVDFAVHRLGPGDVLEAAGDDRERLVLVLEGTAVLSAGETDFGPVGSRVSVFDGPPPAVLLVAPGDRVRVVGEGGVPGALVVIASAPAGPVRRTVLIPSDDILVEHRGSGQTARRVHHLLPPATPAGRLIAFEVFTPAGNWSSYPPHKHDTEDPPREANLQELYFYRFARPTGFAMQRVYTADRALDETMTATDGDIVLVPAGYHVVGAPAGYDCYYLNVMAGPNRVWHFTVDPDHAWLMDWDPTTPGGPEPKESLDDRQ